MALKFTYNMSFENIDKGITSVHKRGSKLREDIHALCVSILARWFETGDVTVPCSKAGALVNNVDGYHAQALVNWFSVYAGFTWNAQDKLFSYSSDKTKITMDDAKAAKDEPYWMLTPPKDPKPFDLPGKLMTLITQAEKRREKGLQDGDSVPSDLIDKLKAALAA